MTYSHEHSTFRNIPQGPPVAEESNFDLNEPVIRNRLSSILAFFSVPAWHILTKSKIV